MLYGKTVVITGVASGIGAQTAQLALSMGADVIGIDVVEPRAPVAFIKADISVEAEIDAVVARLPPRFDALANVAGISGKAGAAKTLAVNFYGLRTLTEKAAPRIREGGSIVNVASIAGFGWRANLERAKALADIPGIPDTSAAATNHGVSDEECYPVSKEALLVWTFRAAHQPLFKDRGIRVNAVSPGPVETPILGEFRQVLGDARVGQRHRPRRPCRNAVGHRACDPVSVFGRRPLDQRRQSGGRRRAGGIGVGRGDGILNRQFAKPTGRKP